MFANEPLAVCKLFCSYGLGHTGMDRHPSKTLIEDTSRKTLFKCWRNNDLTSRGRQRVM